MTEDVPTPITDQFMQAMQTLAVDTGTVTRDTDERFGRLIEAMGTLIEGTAKSIAGLELEIYLLREIVHGNNPEIRLH